MLLDAGYAVFEPNWSVAHGGFEHLYEELGQRLSLPSGMSLCLLEQLRVDLDVELGPSHQTGQRPPNIT